MKSESPVQICELIDRTAHHLHPDTEQISEPNLGNIIGNIFVVLKVGVVDIGAARFDRYIWHHNTCQGRVDTLSILPSGWASQTLSPSKVMVQ